MGLMAKGNYDEAISHIEYVLRLMPQDEIAQKLLAAARQGRDASVPQR
jgi:Flp pilus assembly protein TadD